LPMSERRGVCSECESNPPMVEVHGSAGMTPRRLCGECLFKEFAPAPTSEDAALATSLLESGRAVRMSPEASTEWSDERWAMHEGPLPSEIAVEIALSDAMGVPFAAPQANAVPGPADIHAAMLALVQLRAGICERGLAGPDRFIIEPDQELLSRLRAAELLARIPKPIKCAARAIDGTIHVRCRPLAGDTTWTHFMPSASGGHDYYADLRERFGAKLDDQKVFCLGCQESLIVTIAEVERSRRDYELRPATWNEGRPSFYLDRDPVAARAANAAGAVRMMKCYFGPDDWSDVKTGRTIALRGPKDWELNCVYSESPSSSGVCEKCRARRASWMATDTRDETWLDRQLCSNCTAEELTPLAIADAQAFASWVAGLSEKGKRTAADRIATAVEMLEQRWQRLPVPPDVMAALERCRALARGQGR